MGPSLLPVLGSLEGLLISPRCTDPVGEFSQGLFSVAAELFCRRAGDCLPQPAAACWETALATSLASGAGWVLAKREAEPPIWAFFLPLASVVAIPMCWQPLIRALLLPWHLGQPSQMLVGIKASKNGVSQLFLRLAAAAAHARMGNSSPFIRAFPSTLETLDFHGVREMLWLITGWEEVQSDGLTSLGHVSLQMVLPPLAQAPLNDFREKTCISAVLFVGC